MGVGEKFGEEFGGLFKQVDEEAKQRAARKQAEQQAQNQPQQPSAYEQRKTKEAEARARVERLAQRAAQLLVENEVDPDFQVMNRTQKTERKKVSGGLFPKYAQESVYEEGEKGWTVSWHPQTVRWTGTGPDESPTTIAPVYMTDKHGKQKLAGNGEIISMNLMANGELQYVTTPELPEGHVKSDEMAPVQKPMDAVDYEIAEQRLARFIMQHEDKLQ